MQDSTLMTDALQRIALVINRNLFFFNGTLTNGTAARDEDWLKQRRGRSHHYIIDRGEQTVLISPYAHSGVIFPGDLKTKTFRDVVRCGGMDVSYLTAARYQLATSPLAIGVSPPFIANLMHATHFRNFIVDGFIIPGVEEPKRIQASTIPAKVEVIWEPWAQMMVFKTMNPNSIPNTVELGESDYVLSMSSGWDGVLYRLGKYVWASSITQAQDLYELLRADDAEPFVGWWSKLRRDIITTF